MRFMRAFRELGLYGATAAGLLLGAPASGQDLGQEWTALTAGEAKIVFQVASLEDKIVRRMRTSDESHRYTLEVAMWTGPLAQVPTAQILHVKLSADRFFPDEPDPEVLVGEFGTFEEMAPEFARVRRTKNRIGGIRSQRFHAADIDCVGFVQHFGFSFGDRVSFGTNRVYGYYCADPGVPLTDANVDIVLKGLGIKGKAVP